MNIHAGPGVAVREFPVVKPDGKRGSVDYLLYADGKTIGVVEAKPRGLDPDARSRTEFTFHRPEELLRLGSQDQQLRHRLRHLSVLVSGKLWPVQVEAI